MWVDSKWNQSLLHHRLICTYFGTCFDDLKAGNSLALQSLQTPAATANSAAGACALTTRPVKEWRRLVHNLHWRHSRYERLTNAVAQPICILVSRCVTCVPAVSARHTSGNAAEQWHPKRLLDQVSSQE